MKNPDLTLSFDWDQWKCSIDVLVRPGCKRFLRTVTKYYEVVVFTASVQSYADPLMEALDEENYGFYKLYWEHCTQKSGSYLKDLSRLGRDPKDMIIVDNLPHSYSL